MRVDPKLPEEEILTMRWSRKALAYFIETWNRNTILTEDGLYVIKTGVTEFPPGEAYLTFTKISVGEGE